MASRVSVQSVIVWARDHGHGYLYGRDGVLDGVPPSAVIGSATALGAVTAIGVA